MSELMAFLIRHGYVLVFAAVFVEPVLLAAGALAGAGQLHFALALAVAIAGALVPDLLWFALGRWRGMKVVQVLCRISLEPDSCVRRTEGAFARSGARSLVLTKFIPGLSTVAPPLAGVFRMKTGRFLAFDALGALVWAGSFLVLGLALSDQLEAVAARAASLGGGLLAILLGSLILWIAYKFLHRRHFIRQLRVARISPEELKEKLDAGEDVVVVDLRHDVDFEADPVLIPGALRMDGARLEESHDALPVDRDIVLYCT